MAITVRDVGREDKTMIPTSPFPGATQPTNDVTNRNDIRQVCLDHGGPIAVTLYNGALSQSNQNIGLRNHIFTIQNSRKNWESKTNSPSSRQP
eukprot:1586487-Amphidinium_carterae.1